MANGDQELRIGDVVYDASIGMEVEVVGFDDDGQPRLRPTDTNFETAPVNHGFARTAAQGATLGFSDELYGLSGLLSGGVEGYKRARDAERERLAAYRAANPGKAFAAEMLGGVVTGGGLVGGGRALGAQALRATAAAGRGATRAAGTGLARSVAPQAAQRTRGVGRALTEGSEQLSGRMLSGQGGLPGILGSSSRANVASEAVKRTGADLTRSTGGLGSKLLTGAKIGAAEGAIYGIGSGNQESRDATVGEALKDRALGGLRGGLTGAAFGSGLGAIGHFGGRALDFGKALRVKGGTPTGRRAALERVDESIAISKLQENPRQFKIDADDWVNTQQAVLDSPASTQAQKDKARKALEEWEASGRSVRFAGMRALAQQAADEASQPGAVKRLLADSNDDLGLSAHAAASVGGQQTGLLKRTLDTSERGLKALSDSLVEVANSIGVKRTIGATQRTLRELKLKKQNAAKEAYGKWDALLGTDEFNNVLKNADSKAEIGFQDVIAQLRARFVPTDETDKVATLLFADLQDAVGPVEKASRLTPLGVIKEEKFVPTTTARKNPLNLQKFLNNPDQATPTDVDAFRRGLVELKDRYAKEGGDAYNQLRQRIDDYIEVLDDSIEKHSKKYKKARRRYQVDSRKIEAYENGARDWTNPEALIDALENAWRGKSGRTQRNLTDAQKNQIRNEFKQGVIDSLSDRIQSLEVNADDLGATALATLEDRVRVLAEAGLIPENIKQQLFKKLKTRAQQARLSKRVSAAGQEQVLKQGKTPEGAVEATGLLYGLAGQGGAMGRTLVAGAIYTPAYRREIAEATARRLRQDEASGLLRVANTLKKTEQARLRGGVTRRGITGAAMGGLISPYSEMRFESGQEDALYRPRQARQRQLQERYGLLR